MKEYYFRIADMCIRLESDKKINISEKWIPFMDTTIRKEQGCTIKVSSCEVIEDVPENGYKKEMTLYKRSNKEIKMYHYNSFEDAPFSVVCYRDKDVIEVQYLPSFDECFNDSSGIFKRIGIETLLAENHRLILHASFIKYNDKGILFSAPSGTGKSTQAELWRTIKNANVINGDRAAIGKMNGEWTAWGIPYAGTSRIYKNEKAPICALVFLRQAKTNRIKKLNALEAFRHMYPEVTNHTWDSVFVEKVADIMYSMINDIPIYLLECLPDEGAVELLYHTLKEEGNL